ncbi:hypothetical protein [Thermoanaerobacter sp. A7A]|uniref:hypothetical protein n=1 Tax=Thermoanaerobacter sp. A7A TaxID=1350366 RepID=UPI00235B6309|nr:hypothetical protein [Thermoanaerobacter sp. A7A]
MNLEIHYILGYSTPGKNLNEKGWVIKKIFYDDQGRFITEAYAENITIPILIFDKREEYYYHYPSEDLSIVIGNTALVTGGFNSISGTVRHLASVEKINISALGNAFMMPDLIQSIDIHASTSNGLHDKGVIGCGYFNLNTLFTFSIDNYSSSYIFGTLSVSGYGKTAVSNGTNDRAVFSGGRNSSSYYSNLEYFNIVSFSGANNFGNMTEPKSGLNGTSNGTNERGIFTGGYRGSGFSDKIEYITISTPGNALDFGNLSMNRVYHSCTSNDRNDRALIIGGYSYTGSATIYLNTIEYLTISTLSNSQDFGDLPLEIFGHTSTSNGIGNRAIHCGGNNNNVQINTIYYNNIVSLGNSLEFGFLNEPKLYLSAVSNGQH